MIFVSLLRDEFKNIYGCGKSPGSSQGSWLVFGSSMEAEPFPVPRACVRPCWAGLPSQLGWEGSRGWGGARGLWGGLFSKGIGFVPEAGKALCSALAEHRGGSGGPTAESAPALPGVYSHQS